MTFQLETERLILRDYQPEDLKGFSEMSSDSEFQKFYSEQDCTPEHWQMLINMFIAEASETPRTRYNLAISHKTNNRFIGAVGIRIEESHDERNHQASVGCSLRPDCQQQGLAAEAMLAIVDFGFNQLNVHRVFAETLSDNQAAVSLCHKLGFRKEAEFIEHRYFKNRWWNTSIFAMLADEYKVESL